MTTLTVLSHNPKTDGKEERESRVSERQQLDRREEKCNEKAKKRKTGSGNVEE